jgi:hypothetical protein
MGMGVVFDFDFEWLVGEVRRGLDAGECLRGGEVGSGNNVFLIIVLIRKVVLGRYGVDLGSVDSLRVLGMLCGLDDVINGEVGNLRGVHFSFFKAIAGGVF